MDKPVLIIEMPSQLSTEAIVEIHDFLHGLNNLRFKASFTITRCFKFKRIHEPDHIN